MRGIEHKYGRKFYNGKYTEKNLKKRTNMVIPTSPKVGLRNTIALWLTSTTLSQKSGGQIAQRT